MSAERDHVRAYRARLRVYVLAWWFLLGALLVLVSPLHGQMVPSSDAEGMPAVSGVVYIQKLTPDTSYARWYHDMERCIGLEGDYAAVLWFVTPRPWIDGRHGNDSTYGLYWSPHRIILNSPERLDSALVAHESLHDILAYHKEYADSEPHPKSVYGKGKCAEEFHR